MLRGEVTPIYPLQSRKRTNYSPPLPGERKWRLAHVGCEQDRRKRASHFIASFSEGFLIWPPRTVLGLKYRDTQCGFKAFTREAAQSIFPLKKLRDGDSNPKFYFWLTNLGSTWLKSQSSGRIATAVASSIFAMAFASFRNW